tara:strand:+ start:225 stop:614 length:390 start_codon:yes stop_codon:yes gene_type:complete
MINKRHIFLVALISLSIHCASLIFIAVVFYPIMDDLRLVIPAVQHITTEKTLLNIMEKAINDYNMTYLIKQQLNSATLYLSNEMKHMGINTTEKVYNIEHNLNHSFNSLLHKLDTAIELIIAQKPVQYN